MNNQQGRTDDKNKKNEQRRDSDTKSANEQKSPNEQKGPNEQKSQNDKNKPDDRATGTPDGQQHGGSGRGMKRTDSEDGADENAGGTPSNNKPFADVRKGENHGDDAAKSPRSPDDENAADEDEAEGDTAGSAKPKAR